MPRRRKTEIGPAVALAERGAKRRKTGKLGDNRVEQTTLKRYRQHALWFWQWCVAFGYAYLGTWSDLDSCCADYIEFLWDANQNLSLATDTLSSLQHFLHRRGELKHSWSLITVWRLKEPPCRAPPMSKVTALAMAAQLAFLMSLPGPALGVLLGFFGLLRTGEIFKLTTKDIVFKPDLAGMILNLGSTKGGKRKGVTEFVVIDDMVTVWAAFFWLKGRHPDASVIDCTPAVWRKLFSAVLAALKLTALDLRPYSLRRGGATCMFTETGSLALTVERGRWKHTRTAQLYLVEGALALQNTTLHPHTSAALSQLASRWTF
jgi:hypothetical protein